jgi:uncharacterized protein HemX
MNNGGIKEHQKDCPKVCNYHEEPTREIAGVKSGMHVAVVIVGLFITGIIGLTVYAYNVQSEDIVEVKSKQVRHEKDVANKMDAAVREVRDMKWNLAERMQAIEHRQKELEGQNVQIQKTNNQILSHLKLLISHIEKEE